MDACNPMLFEENSVCTFKNEDDRKAYINTSRRLLNTFELVI